MLNHYKDLRDNKYVAPLRMCLTGEGGTGKTHVIKAVKAYFAELQCRHWLCLAAPTNIEGSTIDSLLHIFDDFESGEKRLRRQAGSSRQSMVTAFAERSLANISTTKSTAR